MAKNRVQVVATVVAASLLLVACSSRQDRGPATPTAAAPTGSIWAADEGGDGLSAIDAATHSVAMTLTGIAGARTAATPTPGSATRPAW